MDYVLKYLVQQNRSQSLNAITSALTGEALTEKAKHVVKHRKGKLKAHLGYPVALKDNICTIDLPTTAASRTLRRYKSPFEATVVEKLQKHGFVIASKTNMDEFGMGSYSTHSYFGRVMQEDGFSAGGSSGGSAVELSEGQAWAALGTDTGGSVRLPAAYTGLVGFKPSYGMISRWGVIAYANSLDTVGILARSVEVAEKIFVPLDAFDDKDPTSMEKITRKRIHMDKTHVGNGSKLIIGYPQEYNIQEMDSQVRQSWIKTLKSLEQRGHTVRPVSLPTTRQALSAYYVLAPAEASSNLARYDGVRYGYRAYGPDDTSTENLYVRTRGKGFGDEVKHRILLGTYTLCSNAIENYFIQAQKVRRLVQQDFDRVFSKANPLRQTNGNNRKGSHTEAENNCVDFIICPTAPTVPPLLESIEANAEPLQEYTNDVFTVPASLAGLPALSVPMNPAKQRTDHFVERGRKYGMQVVGQYGDDYSVLRVGKLLEAIRDENNALH